MFEHIGRFLDVVVVAFVIMFFGSWQLQHAYVIGAFLEGLVAITAIICAVGLFFRAQWSITGMVFTLAAAILIYLLGIFVPSMQHHSAGSVLFANIVKSIITALFLWYVNHQRVEKRFAAE